MSRFGRSPWVVLTTLAFLVLVGWLAVEQDRSGDASKGEIEQLFASQRSGVMVESEGVVIRILRDDLQGSRHQRFILRLASGHSILISHNIDLAPRADRIATGDTVGFRGQYEWNDRGGVVHWTHHDPDGRRPGGWLQHTGRTLR